VRGIFAGVEGDIRCQTTQLFALGKVDTGEHLELLDLVDR
jgi:hypothetical protein